MDEFHRLIDVLVAEPFERAEAEWREVLKWLGLPLFYQPALAMALAKTNWREARDLGRYLRGTTYRQARRMGLVEVKGPVPLSWVLGAESDSGAYARALSGGSLPSDPDDCDDSVYDRVDPGLIECDAFGDAGINWDSVGERAGLNESEVCVLEGRADGLTRAQILEEAAEDAQQRLQLQAAYRNVHRRMPDIAAALQGQCPQNRGRRVHRK